MMTMPFASRRTAPLIAALGLLALAACSNPEKTARYLIDPPATGDMVANRLGTAELKDVSLREARVLGGFAACVLALGVYPKPLTDLMEPSIAQLAMQLANSKL